MSFVGISKAAMNGLYRIFCALSTRKNTVLFLSRQADQSSFDFQQLAAQVQHDGWNVRMHLLQVRSKNNSGSATGGAGIARYALHVLKELRLLAQCKMVVLDRYDPVISLLSFTEGPTIVQLWHAFGAFKKFGHQSIGTAEGHAQQTVDTFSIHKNYTWVAASGEPVRNAYAEAFNCPLERVVVFNRPEYFELQTLRQHQGGAHSKSRGQQTVPQATQPQQTHPQSALQPAQPMVLFAPTLRKSKTSAHPFREFYHQREALQQAFPATIEWAFHPLEEGLPAPGNVNDMLLQASVVVTDYSSIVYEAYLLGKPVVFYMPDRESYLQSPGLNADPQILCPELCAYTPAELAQRINEALQDPQSYATKLVPFASPAFEGAENAPSNLLAIFARS